MDLDLLKKTLDSGAGATLKKHLLARLAELKDIENIEEKGTPTHQAIEIKAQKRAYSKLKEILQDIMTFEESVKPKDPRDSFAVDVDEIIKKEKEKNA